MSKKRFSCLPILFFLILSSCSVTSKYEKIFESYTPTQVLADDWYGVYFLGAKVGYSHIKISTGTLDGEEVARVFEEGLILYRFENEANPLETNYSGESFLTAGGKLLGFTYDQSILSHELKIDAIEKDGFVYVDIYSGGGRKMIKFDTEKNIYPSMALSYLAMTEDITPGKTYQYKVFMENFRTIEDLEVTVLDEMEIEIEEKPYTVLEVRSKIRGYTFTSFITTDKRMIKQVSIDSFESVIENREEATRLGDDSGITMDSLINYALITSDKVINDPMGIELLKVKIKNTPESMVPLEGDSQRFYELDQKNEYIFTIEKVDVDPLFVPDYGKFPEELSEYLAPTIDIESDEKRIISKVNRIVGEGSDPKVDALEIMEWVFKNVSKRMVDATSALDAFSSLEGECQAHAHLFAALARARGIPTKVVSGIVYSEEIGGFLYHTWNEVYLGTWVPLDVTFFQFPADPTHIKFVEGGLDSVLDIIPLVGNIQIEILEIVRD